MSTRRMKRDRSRSVSSDRDSFNERNTRTKNERPSRFSGGGGGGHHSLNSGGNRNPNKSRKVYVSNITFDTTYKDVKEEFSKVGDVTFVKLIKDDFDKFKGCATVTFKEPEMATEAIETMNRREYKGRKLVVKEEEANPELKNDRNKRSRDDYEVRPLASLNIINPQSLGNLPNALGNPGNFNTYGLSMPFLESLKIDLPLVNIVFVANLDYTVEEKNLKDVFSLAGKVIESELFKDKEGNSRGFGIVEYEHPVESVQAISMLHNQPFRDRLLTVRMDRSDRKKDQKTKLPSGLKSIGMGLGVNGDPLRDVKRTGLGSQVNTPSLASQLNPGMGLMDSLTSRMGPNAGGLVSALALGNRDFGNQSQNNSGYNNNPGGITLGNIIQISNLPLDYTNDMLRKLCWGYGDVRVAEMRSQGNGMVKFRNEADAQRAVEMLDNLPLEGRLLSVRSL